MQRPLRLAHRRDRGRPAVGGGQCPGGQAYPLAERPAGGGGTGADYPGAGRGGVLRLCRRRRLPLHGHLSPGRRLLGEAAGRGGADHLGPCAPGGGAALSDLLPVRRRGHYALSPGGGGGAVPPPDRRCAPDPGHTAGGAGTGVPLCGGGPGGGAAADTGLVETAGLRPGVLHPGSGAEPLSWGLVPVPGDRLPADGPHLPVSKRRGLRLPGPAAGCVRPAVHLAGAGQRAAAAVRLPAV